VRASVWPLVVMAGASCVVGTALGSGFRAILTRGSFRVKRKAGTQLPHRGGVAPPFHATGGSVGCQSRRMAAQGQWHSACCPRWGGAVRHLMSQTVGAGRRHESPERRRP
jgi:hypothetical protein